MFRIAGMTLVTKFKVKKYHTNVVSKVSVDICNWPPIGVY